jgi:hypothetical protein|tara:strand:+ start:201405 stop:201659 length:255 start_codon:yes stop_codon:yes gene_type:complete
MHSFASELTRDGRAYLSGSTDDDLHNLSPRQQIQPPHLVLRAGSKFETPDAFIPFSLSHMASLVNLWLEKAVAGLDTSPPDCAM